MFFRTLFLLLLPTCCCRNAATTAAVLARQQHYMAQSVFLTLQYVRGWPWWRRMWNNALATAGPVL